MKILFAPSESKNKNSNLQPINKNSFIFESLFDKRLEILHLYNTFIQKADVKELAHFFQLKNEKDILSFKKDIFKEKSSKAIQRYNGVAFEYLDFENLSTKAKEYIFENTIIFSNLFGPVLARDEVPNYKFKQGAKLDKLDLASFYKKHFSPSLDAFLKDEEIIDLRAGFYEKFYSLKQKFSTYKFIKNNKIISHFAKAYRGLLLRILASKQLQNNEALLANLPSNLKLKDIKIIGLKQEISLEILD